MPVIKTNKIVKALKEAITEAASMPLPDGSHDFGGYVVSPDGMHAEPKSKLTPPVHKKLVDDAITMFHANGLHAEWSDLDNGIKVAAIGEAKQALYTASYLLHASELLDSKMNVVNHVTELLLAKLESQNAKLMPWNPVPKKSLKEMMAGPSPWDSPIEVVQKLAEMTPKKKKLTPSSHTMLKPMPKMTVLKEGKTIGQQFKQEDVPEMAKEIAEPQAQVYVELSRKLSDGNYGSVGFTVGLSLPCGAKYHELEEGFEGAKKFVDEKLGELLVEANLKPKG